MRKRRWFQYSLRSLLLFTLLVGVGLSWLTVKMRQADRQREAVVAIKKSGGDVWYGYQMDANGHPAQKWAQPPEPAWLRTLFRNDLFSNVVRVEFAVGATDTTLAQLSGLPHVEQLDLTGTQVTDAGLGHLEGFSRLRLLALDGTHVTDKGLSHITRMTRLEYLGLDSTKTTDAGIGHIARLPRLRVLVLGRTEITDAGLEQLSGLTELRRLTIDGTRVTKEGIRTLQQALPRCVIDD